MTSFAFILGIVPLVNAEGAGAASRRALGTAVFGGMLAATFLAVFFVPVFFVVIQRFAEYRRGPRGRPGPADARRPSPSRSRRSRPSPPGASSRPDPGPARGTVISPRAPGLRGLDAGRRSANLGPGSGDGRARDLRGEPPCARSEPSGGSGTPGPWPTTS